MSEFFSDFRDFISERFRSPLWLSIIFSWLLLNWEVPITALFETSQFSVSYLNEYFTKNSIHQYTTIPVVTGLFYCVTFGAIRNLLVVLARIPNSLVANLDRKTNLYKWVSRTEHEAQIDRIKRDAENGMYFDQDSKRDPLNQETLTLKTDKKTNSEPPQRKQRDKNESPENSNINNAIIRYANQSTSAEFYKELHQTLPLSLQQKLKDPNGRPLMLLTLYSLRAPNVYSKKPDISRFGLQEREFKNCIKTLESADLVREATEGYDITPKGGAAVKNLEKDEELKPIASMIEKADTAANSQILELLKEKALTKKQIADSVVFTPNFNNIISSLNSQGKIEISGDLIFYKNT